MNKSRSVSLIAFFLLLASKGTGLAAEDQVPEGVGSDGEPLVSRFNSDVGKVRAIFLASPT